MKSDTKITPKEDVLPYAVKLLASRSYSTRRLRSKLREKGYVTEQIDEAIAKLTERKLLDDRRFAEGFVRTRVESHPRGRTALVRDLVTRGVSGSVANQAVNEQLSAEQELDLAKDLIRRKSRQYDSLEPETRRRRLVALLARRGFRPDTIHQALSISNSEPSTEEAY